MVNRTIFPRTTHDMPLHGLDFPDLSFLVDGDILSRLIIVWSIDGVLAAEFIVGVRCLTAREKRC